MDDQPHSPRDGQAHMCPADTFRPDGFIPHCPSCGYDLSASPDGACPECGTFFTHERLCAAEWQRRAIRPPSHTDLGLAIVFSVLSFGILLDDLSVQLVMLGIIWALVGSWLVRHRKHLLDDGRELRLLWLIVPIFRTAAGFIFTPFALPTVAAALAGSVVLSRFVYRKKPAQTIAALGLSSGAPLLCVGLWFTGEGLGGVLQGHHWSDWDYPRWLWKYVQSVSPSPYYRPVLFSYLMWFGLSMLVASLPPLCLGFAALLRRRSRIGGAS